MADPKQSLSESESTDEEESDGESSCSPQDVVTPTSKSEVQSVRVLVTGFGPFAGHEVNASWEAVKELQKLGVAHGVSLATAELPVCYAAVSSLVPRLWEQHCPQLVVHVGVSGMAKEITLETQAFNDGYTRADVEGELPPGQRCCAVASAHPRLRSSIDMALVCEEVNNSCCLAAAVTSDDPGRYLCDFTFYTSLNIDSGHTAFVHVPPLDSPYSVHELAHGLQTAVRAMLKQLGLYRQPPLPPGHALPDYSAHIDAYLFAGSGSGHSPEAAKE